jgi:hypothetical protein
MLSKCGVGCRSAVACKLASLYDACLVQVKNLEQTIAEFQDLVCSVLTPAQSSPQEGFFQQLLWQNSEHF